MSETRTLRYYEAMREAITEEMTADAAVILLGTSIRAGTFPHTKGLCERFGEDRHSPGYCPLPGLPERTA